MARTRGPGIRKLIGRNGRPVSVRRTAGAMDMVTSTRPATAQLQVDTKGVPTRPEQRSERGDPLTTLNAYYLVMAEPFEGQFEPRDGDLVLDGASETRVLGVRPQYDGCRVIAYRLMVSGVAFEGR